MSHGSGKLARLRLYSLCFLALSVSLGVALVSLAKLMLLIAVLLQVLSDVRHRATAPNSAGTLPWPSTLWWGAAALLWMGLSITWSAATASEAWLALSRHARWLVLPAAFYLMRAGTPAWPVLQCLVAGQLFVLLSSWLMVMGIPLPWAISVMSPDNAVVFTSTIEQPIMNTLMMLVVWYFRDQWHVPYRRFAVWAVLALTSANVLLVVPGRAGQITLLLAWVFILVGILPSRHRWMAVLVPVLVAGAVALGSDRMQQRWLKAQTDIQALQDGPPEMDNSVGYRLQAWQISAESLAQKPVFGHGVGGWKKAYADQGGAIKNADDPHQQFLLWAVEGGLIGLTLFSVFLFTLWRVGKPLKIEAALSLRAFVGITCLAGISSSVLIGAVIGEFLFVSYAILLANPNYNGVK
jgi:O-antigen ligase